MNDFIKNKLLAAGAVITLIGGITYGVFTFTADGQTFEIPNDGVSPKEELIVTKKVTKEVAEYSQSLNQVNNSLAQALLERERLEVIIARLQAEKAEIEAELAKIPDPEVTPDDAVIP